MRFTASKSPLLTICLYPFRDDVTAPEAPDDPYTRVGTVVWARLASVIDGKADPGNGELPEAEAARVDLLFAIGKRWLADHRAHITSPRCEIKYGWSPSRDQARELPKTYDEKGRENLRDYASLVDDEIAGSTDLEYLEDGLLVVEDIKTGYTPLAQYAPQIRTLALFAARARGARRVKAVLTKFHDDKLPESISVTLDAFALDAIAQDLRTRREATAAAEPVPGAHCTEMFCPARLACPAVPTLIGELVPADALVRLPKFSHAFISHDHDARMLDLLRLIKKAAEDMKTVIENRTPEAGVQLADGRWLGEGTHPETSWSKERLMAKARDLLSKQGLTDEQIDVELEPCRTTFAKSGGLKVTKGPPKKAALPAKEKAA